MTDHADLAALRPDIVWTDDCQGKKDYDGALIEVSTRYYPRGGGFHILDETGFHGNEARPDIRPSAHSSIILRALPGDVTLVDARFDGETQGDVQRQVEAWVAARFREAATALAGPVRDQADVVRAETTGTRLLTDEEHEEAWAQLRRLDASGDPYALDRVIESFCRRRASVLAALSNTGWVCPKCGQVYAPTKWACNNCGGKTLGERAHNG